MITFQNIIILFIILSIIVTAVVTIYIYIKINADNNETKEEKEAVVEKEIYSQLKESILIEKKDLIEEIDYNKGLLN